MFEPWGFAVPQWRIVTRARRGRRCGFPLRILVGFAFGAVAACSPPDATRDTGGSGADAPMCIYGPDCDLSMPFPCGMPRTVCAAFCIQPPGGGGFYCSRACQTAADCDPTSYPCCSDDRGRLPQRMCVPTGTSGSCPP